ASEVDAVGWRTSENRPTPRFWGFTRREKRLGAHAGQFGEKRAGGGHYFVNVDANTFSRP
ncbi:hypothetical protein, partial [Achromobacter piechaudii]|uniref:hypothetical protein n=1 Tax=Achromobacter piechaudii TaxID=72556 RepID=UPI001C3F1CFB